VLAVAREPTARMAAPVRRGGVAPTRDLDWLCPLMLTSLASPAWGIALLGSREPHRAWADSRCGRCRLLLGGRFLKHGLLLMGPAALAGAHGFA